VVKSCERCRQARIHLSLIFAVLIVLNFTGRLLLGIKTTSLLEVMVLPSFGLIICGVVVYIFINKKG
jgi:hypothetical protein|tara:strand:+ start:313 stop:513 length:201 start_codon:yes stop_codon:yes gene_type:complete